MDRNLNRGFSLLEIMVALGVTSVALLAMIGVFTGGLKLLNQSQAVTLATEAGRGQLEAIKDMGWGALPAADTAWDGRVADPAVAGFPPAPYPGNPPMRVSVEEIQPGLKSVSVMVYWQPNTPITLETYVVEPPTP